jgi:hypothetical protein
MVRTDTSCRNGLKRLWKGDALSVRRDNGGRRGPPAALLLDNVLTAHGRAPFSGLRRILAAMAEGAGAPAQEPPRARRDS